MAENDPFPGASDAELLVLRALWTLGEASPSELREHLAAGGLDRAYTTVQTLLHRLRRKGWIERRRDGVAQRYRPTVSEDELVVRHMDELARRVGRASGSSLVRSFVRGGKLEKREIERLRALLDEAEAKARGPGRRRRR